MSFLTDSELKAKAAKWLEDEGFDVDRELVVDGVAVRLKEPAAPSSVRSVCVWVSSEPAKVSYYDHHSRASGCSYLDTIKKRAGMER